MIGTIEGCADAAGPIESFIAELGAEAQRVRASRVVADLRELEFATTACIKLLANWLVTIADQDDPYTVELRSNPRHSWQRRSLSILASCAPGRVEVTVP